MNWKRFLPFVAGWGAGAFCTALFFSKKVTDMQIRIDELYDLLSGDTGDSEELEGCTDDIAVDTDISEMFDTEEEADTEPEIFPGGDFELRIATGEECVDLINHEDFTVSEMTHFMMSDTLMEGTDCVNDILERRIINCIGYDWLLRCADDEIIYVANDLYKIIYEVHVKQCSYHDWLVEMGYVTDDE